MTYRKACAVALVAISLISSSVFGEERENSLDVWMSQFLKSANGTDPPVSITSKLLMKGEVPSIKFRLTNTSDSSLYIYPHELPWGNVHSISLVAVRSDGTLLPNVYRISDPGPADQFEIKPGESLEGLYPIERIVPIEPSERKHDIFLAWSYLWWDSKSKQPSSPITGVVVIPAQKAASNFSSKPTP